MRYLAMAFDYDATLADNGSVDLQVIAALERLAASKRLLIINSGRMLHDLKNVFPQVALFDAIVAENGATLYSKKTEREVLLTKPASRQLVDDLLTAGVAPIVIGRSIIATTSNHALQMQESITKRKLDYAIIMNKGSAMALPVGIDKGSGLVAAARELGIDVASIISMGDAENDLSLFSVSGLGIAVANAVPELKDIAGLVTKEARGGGVIEAINLLLDGELELT